MEHNAIQWVGAPSCQRGSYAFYKSVSSRAQPDGPLQVWKLGEFYFIQCGPQDPVCIAEVKLFPKPRVESILCFHETALNIQMFPLGGRVQS
ncbi:hypothetical protein AMECASPLE_010663 [Ameca splendens]|uniref:Uncharacterized protein n=1 Tax=Ameca splendens TaxID=208324 RepID=A0ABV0XPV7_9TELE